MRQNHYTLTQRRQSKVIFETSIKGATKIVVVPSTVVSSFVWGTATVKKWGEITTQNWG